MVLVLALVVLVITTAFAELVAPVVSHVWADLVGHAGARVRYKLPHVIDLSAFQVLLLTVTSWLDRREREVLAYLVEENRLLRRQVDGRHLRLTDVTPDTLRRGHRQLIARKWTYAKKGTSRRGVLAEIR